MKYEEKRVTLSDGTIVFLRSPERADAPLTLEYLNTVFSQTRFLSALPGEKNITLEQEENWVQKQLDGQNSMDIGAFKDGTLIGMAGVVPIGSPRQMHRATLGISVLKEYWHLGLGTLLMRETISAAQRMGFEYLELTVAAGNERAVRLYQKFGFSVYGTYKNGNIYPDGTYDDVWLMNLELGN